MSKSLSLLIAWRFLRVKRKSTLVYLISFLSTLGIMLGVAALIIGLSAMNGFQQQLYKRILSVIPNAQIINPSGKLDNWKEITQALRQQPNITVVMPYISLTGLIEAGKHIDAIQVQGIDPTQEQTHWSLAKFVSSQGWQKLASSPQNSIVIGTGLAQKLNVTVGDWITLLLSSNQSDLQKITAPKRVRLQIVGILNLSGQLGYQMGFMNLDTTQKLLGLGEGVSGIAVNVSHVFQVNQIINNVLSNLPFDHLEATTWTFNYGYIYQDIQMIRTIMYLAMLLVIGVACFNIVSTLMITVKDKQSDIAILRTLGASSRLIRGIFIYYGLLCGLTGTVIGCVMGGVISIYLTHIMQFIQQLFGHPILASDIYFIDFIPSQLHFKDILLVFITSIILSLLASSYPAYRAGRLNPVDILKAK